MAGREFFFEVRYDGRWQRVARILAYSPAYALSIFRVNYPAHLESSEWRVIERLPNGKRARHYASQDAA